jgi:hypothetical protein
VIDQEAILRHIPVEEKNLTPPFSVFHARIHSFKRSPIMLRPRKSQKARNSCGSADIICHDNLSKTPTMDVSSLESKAPVVLFSD